MGGLKSQGPCTVNILRVGEGSSCLNTHTLWSLVVVVTSRNNIIFPFQDNREEKKYKLH